MQQPHSSCVHKVCAHLLLCWTTAASTAVHLLGASLNDSTPHLLPCSKGSLGILLGVRVWLKPVGSHSPWRIAMDRVEVLDMTKGRG